MDIQNSALKAIKVLIVVLQGLTGMQDLWLDRCLANSLTAKIMSGLQHLSVLKLHRVNNDKFELGGQRDHCYRSKIDDKQYALGGTLVQVSDSVSIHSIMGGMRHST